MDLSPFNDALVRLDAEIAEAEERLVDLRLKRTGAEAFLAYMQATATTASATSTTTTPNVATPPRQSRSFAPTGATEIVESIMLAREGAVVRLDDVWSQAQVEGHDLTRDQVKNALHYLTRKKMLVNVSRGAWLFDAPRDAETPVAAGVSVGNVLPDQEGGDSHETTAATASTAEDHSDPQLGASITEVAS